MNRRNFLKSCAAALVTTRLLFPLKAEIGTEMETVTDFIPSNEQIFHVLYTQHFFDAAMGIPQETILANIQDKIQNIYFSGRDES